MYQTPASGRGGGRGRGRGTVNGRQGGHGTLISNSILGGRGGQQQHELQSMTTTHPHRNQSSNPLNIIQRRGSSSYDSRLFGINDPLYDSNNNVFLSPFCQPVAASTSGAPPLGSNNVCGNASQGGGVGGMAATAAAAAAVASQEGDAASASDTPDEVDHFSVQAQMVLLMDKNNSSKNNNTFDANRAKVIYCPRLSRTSE